MTSSKSAPGRWTAERANDWYDAQPWLVGANFVPSTASNQLEMWQAETFDPDTIERELGWAAGLGMNSMRVFLHDLLWQDDAAAFQDRIDAYLDIAAEHGISTMLVLFDSVWNPDPRLGPQDEPQPGLHNSAMGAGAGQCGPCRSVARGRLQNYVEGVVGAFANDERVIMQDVWNEPSNTNNGKFVELPNKRDLVAALLPKAFAWARNANPSQPLTAGYGPKRAAARSIHWPAIRQMEHSTSSALSTDYQDAGAASKPGSAICRATGPLLLTEYIARKAGSTFEGILPIARREKIASLQLGLRERPLPDDSTYPGTAGRRRGPSGCATGPVKFHDIFYADGRAYLEDEVALIRRMTGIDEA